MRLSKITNMHYYIMSTSSYRQLLDYDENVDVIAAFLDAPYAHSNTPPLSICSLEGIIRHY